MYFSCTTEVHEYSFLTYFAPNEIISRILSSSFLFMRKDFLTALQSVSTVFGTYKKPFFPFLIFFNPPVA